MKRVTWDRIDETGGTWKYFVGAGKYESENGGGARAVGGDRGPNMVSNFWAGDY